MLPLAAQHRPSSALLRRPRGSLRVLMVESAPNLRTQLHEALLARGHSVELLPHAKGLITAQEREPASLVIIGARPGDVDRAWLCRDLRCRAGDDLFDILVLAHDGSRHEMLSLLEAGATNLLPRPFQLTALDSHLRRIEERALERRRELEKQLMINTTQAIRDAPGFAAALAAALRQLCNAADFCLGQYWRVSATRQRLECTPIWYALFPGFSPFHADCLEEPIAPGVGPTGRAFQLSCAQWAGDLQHELDLPWRGRVQQAGLRATVAIPLFAAHANVAAVLELWASTPRLIDRDLLALASMIGKQLMARSELWAAARELRAS